MYSQIILTVEHEEDTDGLTALVESFKPSSFHDPYRVSVVETDIKVDVTPPLTPQDALTELIDMGVDESRIAECKVADLPALYLAVCEESSAQADENEAKKTIIPEKVYDAIQACAIRAENSDNSMSGWLTKEANIVKDWLETQADYE